jgi:hypothetical protein
LDVLLGWFAVKRGKSAVFDVQIPGEGRFFSSGKTFFNLLHGFVAIHYATFSILRFSLAICPIFLAYFGQLYKVSGSKSAPFGQTKVCISGFIST